MSVRLFFIVALFVCNLFADDVAISNLLSKYQNESDLSNKTKRESSGILHLYTREDLERMQVKSLKDVLKTVPAFNLYKNRYNFSVVSTASNPMFPMTGIRIFINDHDMTSVTFGSGFLLWGDLNIEYIDHIEVYEATSSVEFGNETAPIVIKLYTKRADREEGSKLRVVGDEKGSSIFNFYRAKVLNDNSSYFVYAEAENLKKKTYHKEFNEQRYNLKNNLADYNIYANYIYKDWFFEIGMIAKNMDSFLGLGTQATPANNGNNMNAKQQYLNITKKFNNGIKLQFSVDNIDYVQNLKDLNGIFIDGLDKNITNYDISFNENIYSVVVDKTFKNSLNKLFVGGFYKRKTLSGNSLLTTSNDSSNGYDGSYDNSIDYSSIYAEDEFKIMKKVSLIGQLKEDIYDYSKEVKNSIQTTYRAGIKYKDKKLFLQFLYTHSYLPIPFYQYYSINRVPYKANNSLVSSKHDIYVLSSKYKFSDSFVKLALSENSFTDPIVENRSHSGFKNLNKKTKYDVMELSYHKEFNSANSFEVAFYDSYNHSDKLYSPKYGVNLQFFNKFRNIDIYNEFVCKSSYNSYNGIKIDDSVDWTSAVKYHATKDLSIGVRGENLLDRGLKQAYQPLSYSVPVVERNIWLNLEYIF